LLLFRELSQSSARFVESRRRVGGSEEGGRDRGMKGGTEGGDKKNS